MRDGRGGWRGWHCPSSASSGELAEMAGEVFESGPDYRRLIFAGCASSLSTSTGASRAVLGIRIRSAISTSALISATMPGMIRPMVPFRPLPSPPSTRPRPSTAPRQQQHCWTRQRRASAKVARLFRPLGRLPHLQQLPRRPQWVRGALQVAAQAIHENSDRCESFRSSLSLFRGVS